jgi:peptidoglycan/LPS O-acetylase OafA/YrhL
MPAQATMLAVCTFVAIVLLPREDAFRCGVTSMFNLLCLGNRMDILGTYAVGPLLHTWSLALEDQFYFMWPIALCAALGQRGDRRWLVCFVVLGIIASACSRGWLHYTGIGGPEMYFGVANRADSLLLGCLAGMLTAWNLLPKRRWFRLLLSAAGALSAIFLGFVAVHATHMSAYLFRGGFTLIALAAAICVLALTLTRIPILSWTLERRVTRATGRLSYGLYLWHWPVLSAFSFKLPYFDKMLFEITQSYSVPAVLGATLLIATISHFCIERAFLRLRPN